MTSTPVRADLDVRTTPVARHDVFASVAGPIAWQDVDTMTPAMTVTDTQAIVDRALGTCYFIVAEDVHGNRSAL